MYAGNYGYPNNPAGSPQYNGGAPHPGSQNSAMQPGTSSNQMMYNAQQFPMGAQSGTAFPGNPSMMAGVAPPGMMQNTGMPHMANANGQSKLAFLPSQLCSITAFCPSLASLYSCLCEVSYSFFLRVRRLPAFLNWNLVLDTTPQLAQ